MKQKKAVFNWSGGKDSSLALLKVLQTEEFEVVSLLTTINQASQTSSIHAVPIQYIQEQADSIGLPLYIVELSKESKNYEDGMLKAVEYFKTLDVKHFIFGDIFLEDVRKYREERLIPHGIELIEPLWGLGSNEVMKQFLASGLESKIVVTQADKLGATFIGKTIDLDFVKALPKDVDVCGENGEYHSFCFDGPIFNSPIHFPITSAISKSYSFKMENNEMKTFKYWQAVLKDER